jgi:hypothetical protein
MWSIKALSLLISMTLVGCTYAQEAANNICPARSNSSVETVDVYDGPVADMAILMPDEANETRGLWNLAYVYEAGRTVNKTTMDINLAKKINQCQFNIMKDKSLVLRCK